jgi:predicted lysophospholipase L1 biosynthesis ABC-type transport system permease subunit
MDMLEKFFQTEVGQKFLLLLAPFFLNPHECLEGNKQHPLFKYLSLSAFAPALGAVFLVGAIVSLYRILENQGYPIAWLIDLSSAKLIFWGAGIITFITYALALSRKMAGYWLKILHPQEANDALDWPLAFWLSYYGGSLIIIGALAALFSGFMAWKFSFIVGLITFICLVLLCAYVRFELKFMQEKRRRHIPYQEWRLYNIVTLVCFAILLAGPVIVWFKFR